MICVQVMRVCVALLTAFNLLPVRGQLNSATGLDVQKLVLDNPKSLCSGIPRLDIYPGRGWDNLRNEEMAQVTALSYDQCKTTEDGRYLIPDNSYVVSIKQSNVDLFSELIDNWSNLTSLTSRSFNIDGSITTKNVGISASFSNEYQDIKRRQVDEKSVTFRVHARYTVYEVVLDSTKHLDNDFKDRIGLVIDALLHNKTKKADFLLELIVRDYGTHLTTHNYAGAIVSKEDFVLQSFALTNEEKITEMKASASASFFKTFSFGANYDTKTDESVTQGYTKSTTSSHVQSFGGTLFKPNQSVSSWIDTIYANLASIDRKGADIHSVITPWAFPGQNLTLLELVRQWFRSAVTRYYHRNEHRGCMSMDKLNFDYNANLDNGMCQEPFNNYSFAGLYQQCEGDYCRSHKAMKNPLTGDYTCPPKYEPVVLNSDSYTTRWTECHGWWIFKSCDDYSQDNTYTTVWCAALDEQVPKNTGVMFGGLYTSTVANPVTEAKSCPPTYIDVLIMQDLHVCISNDYELGYKYSIPFGGLFSCKYGNPLFTRLKAVTNLFKSGVSATANDYVQSCPKGYTQHSAVIDADCLISYCVKAGSFSVHGQMPVVLPPFHSYHYMFDGDDMSSQPDQYDSGLSGGAIAGICIGLLAVFVLLALMVILVNKSRRARQQGYVAIDSDDTPVQPVQPIEINSAETNSSVIA